MLVLTHYVGLPAPEVARILGIPTGTVYSRLHYGTRRCGRPLAAADGRRPPARSLDDERVDRSSARRLAATRDPSAVRAKAWNERSPRPVGRRQRPGWTFPERWLPMQLSMARTPSHASDRRDRDARPADPGARRGGGAHRFATARAASAVRIARNGAVVFEEDGDLFIADAARRDEHGCSSAAPTGRSDPVFSNQGDRIAFIREVKRWDPAHVRSGRRVRPHGRSATSRASIGFRLVARRQFAPRQATRQRRPAPGLRLAVVEPMALGSRELDIGMAADWASWRPDGRHIAFRGQRGRRTRPASSPTPTARTSTD